MLHVKQYVNSVLSSNAYLLWKDGEQACWLIDCGDTFLVLKDIASLGMSLEGILLTHAHFDHIYGLNDILKIFGQAKVYTTSFGCEALLSDKLNLSKYTGNSFILSERASIQVIEDNSFLMSILGMEVAIYHVPGHNPSCLAYGVGKYLFTGDAYIPEVKVVTNIPRANKEEAKLNYEKLRKLSSDKHLLVCAGHGKIVKV